MALRGGDGIVINFDGDSAEIALSRPDFFVALITGTQSGTDPKVHKWKRQEIHSSGKYYIDAVPAMIGNGTKNPAYLPAGVTSISTATGYVFMRPRGNTDSGEATFEIIGGAGSSGGGGGGGGGETFEVVTSVTCNPEGITVTTAELSGADYTTSVFKDFIGLVDVIPKSYAGQANRIVMVNSTASGIEFGPSFSGAPTAADFLGLTDTPSTYSSAQYKTVVCTTSGLTFTAMNITTAKSLAGGGNPFNSFTALTLVNDLLSPGNDYYYGTNSSGVKGWQSSIITTQGAALVNVTTSAVDNSNLANLASTTQAAITALELKINAVLSRLRSIGAIVT